MKVIVDGKSMNALASYKHTVNRNIYRPKVILFFVTFLLTVVTILSAKDAAVMTSSATSTYNSSNHIHSIINDTNNRISITATEVECNSIICKIKRFFHNLFHRHSRNRTNTDTKRHEGEQQQQQQQEEYEHIKIDRTLVWAGKRITDNETKCLQALHAKMTTAKTDKAIQGWLQSKVTDMDLLRFARKYNSNVNDTWKALLAHNNWRASTYGCDSIHKHNFHSSELNLEAFWLGEDNLDSCPTLVVRTQLHDGIHYNEDATIFTGFIVHLLEEGRKLYGVGDMKQVCLILDRSTVVSKTKNIKEKVDMSLIPKLAELFSTLYSTLNDNYPDLLKEAKIFPTSWFFSACYKITSRIFDPVTRNRFVIISEENIFKEMKRSFPDSLIPLHLGGTARGKWDLDTPQSLSSGLPFVAQTVLATLTDPTAISNILTKGLASRDAISYEDYFV